MFREVLRSSLIIIRFLALLLISFFSYAFSRPQSQAKSRSITPKVKETVVKQQYNFGCMPKDAWDSHMHVTSPKYGLVPNAAYKPALHSLADARAFENSIAISNMVLVQPSIYGNDNSCLLDALKELGPVRGRGVVGVDPDSVEVRKLLRWHKLGVRGVRLNLKSTNASFTEDSLRNTMRSYAQVVRPLNWVLELFIAMESIPMLERVSADLGVRLCIAHCGAPQLPDAKEATYPLDPYQLAGFDALVRMLHSGKTWVKLSAAYRFDNDPEMRGIEAVAKELLKQAGNRVIFASDWPHTRFEKLNVRPFVERCLEWTEAAGLTDQVFSHNAQELWSVTEENSKVTLNESRIAAKLSE